MVYTRFLRLIYGDNIPAVLNVIEDRFVAKGLLKPFFYFKRIPILPIYREHKSLELRA
jgi:hypothetical protein